MTDYFWLLLLNFEFFFAADVIFGANFSLIDLKRGVTCLGVFFSESDFLFQYLSSFLFSLSNLWPLFLGFGLNLCFLYFFFFGLLDEDESVSNVESDDESSDSLDVLVDESFTRFFSIWKQKK